MATLTNAQAALQFITTYGWMMLIIMVVLGILFNLGFFSSSTYAPRAAAGSCQVQRPLGAGTTQEISLQGQCNNQIPQFVGQFTAPGTNYFMAPMPASMTNGTLTL